MSNINLKYFAWLIPLEFYLKQNNFYGWNATPKSDGELIADGIVLLIVVLVAIFIQTCNKPTISLNISNRYFDHG